MLRHGPGSIGKTFNRAVRAHRADDARACRTGLEVVPHAQGKGLRIRAGFDAQFIDREIVDRERLR